MSFRNLQIELAELPHAASIQWQALDSRLPMVLVLETALVGLPVVIGAGVITAVNGPELLWVAAPMLAAALIAACIYAWYAARARRYAVREHDIAYRSGLLWRKSVFLAFDRVQHIELSVNPVERRFSLATLKFYTAGGAQADLKVRGLQERQAAALRRHILDPNVA